MDKTEDSSLQDSVLQFVKSNFLILALFSAGLMFLGIGLIQYFGAKNVAIEFEKASGLPGQRPGGEKKIKVDVEGQVLKPGVYELDSDARMQDALIAAGGLTPDANRKAINLAQKLGDGQKIYIPAVGEAVTSASIMGDSASGLVSVNSASETELEKLPAIGPVTAGKIIDGRPYGSVQELLDRKIVGKATYEKIKNLITL